MSLLGAAGLERVAAASLQRTADLVAALSRVAGVKPAFAAPRFHEAVLLLDRPVAPVLAALARRGIFGGLDLADRYPELGHALLVCATETKLQPISIRMRRPDRHHEPVTRRGLSNHYDWGRTMAELQAREPLIFELSKPGRQAGTQFPPRVAGSAEIPRICAARRRHAPGGLRVAGGATFHAAIADEFLDRYAFLSLGFLHHEVQPKVCNTLAMLPEFLGRHPLGPASRVHGLHVRTAGDAAGNHGHAEP